MAAAGSRCCPRSDGNLWARGSRAAPGSPPSLPLVEGTPAEAVVRRAVVVGAIVCHCSSEGFGVGGQWI
jgi:hypothetical protein